MKLLILKRILELLEGVENLSGTPSERYATNLASSASKVTIEREFWFQLYFTHICSGEDFPKSKPDPILNIACSFSCSKETVL
jgi:hypothetical protein